MHGDSEDKPFETIKIYCACVLVLVLVLMLVLVLDGATSWRFHAQLVS